MKDFYKEILEVNGNVLVTICQLKNKVNNFQQGEVGDGSNFV